MNYTDAKKPDPKDEDLATVADLIDRRLRAADAERWEWSVEKVRAQRYYESQQWGDLSRDDADHTMPVTANVVRRDVDQIVAAILDADPVVNPKGRHGRHDRLGRRLLDAVKWSRDEEENFFNDLEDVTTDGVHTGEGCGCEEYDFEAADGLGMPRMRWVENTFLLWDPAAREFQRDDAEWIIEYRPRKVDYLEAKWAKKLKGKQIEPDVPDLLIGQGASQDQHQSGYSARYMEYRQRLGMEFDAGSEDWRTLEPQAYEKIMWEKKVRFEERYTDAETGKLELVEDEDGTRRPMNEEEHGALSPEEKKRLVPTQVEVPELWKTVCINNHIVERELSIYDKSKGGHGHFPYFFFTYVRLRTRSHGKGEIEYLVGLQDLINRTMSRWLEQLMIAGSQFVASQVGSMPAEDMEKAENIGRKPLQHLRYHPGFQPPSVQGGNPVGANLFAGGYSLLSGIKDQVSGVRDVNRGDMPYQTSGKGIRALQSQADLLGTVPRKHIESALRRATVMRLSNMLQFMRGNRLAEAIDSETGEKRALYIGESLGELLAEYPDDLQVMVDKQSGQALIDPASGEPLALAEKATGEEAHVLVLNDEEAAGIDMTQIEYELDTGRERNKAERMEIAREALQAAGPALIEWYLTEMEVPNKDMAVEALKKQGLIDRLAEAVEAAAGEHGLEPAQVVEVILADLQGAPEAPAEGGPAPPPGPPAPTPNGVPTGAAPAAQGAV